MKTESNQHLGNLPEKCSPSIPSLILLALWMANIAAFLFYFLHFGFADYPVWLGK